MKPNLYICHTAYQVLVDLLRASRTDGQPHTMVLSAAVPEPQSLAKKLRPPALSKSLSWTRPAGRAPSPAPSAARRARRAFEKLCGWRFTRAAYNEVRIHNDWSVLGRYLQDCHAGYILCEDTFCQHPRPRPAPCHRPARRPPILPGSSAPEKATFTGATARGAQKWKARTPRNARCSPPAAW